MPSTWRVLVVFGVLLVLVLPTSAQADQQRFRDARSDTTTSADIWWVRVDNSSSSRSKVIVAVRQDTIRTGDSIDIYFDTRPRDPGPEFFIGGIWGSEYNMAHMERWNAIGKSVPFRCGYRLRGDTTRDSTRAVIPRRCLGNPSKIRVAVKVERDYPPISRDWAKARRTWFDWVRR